LFIFSKNDRIKEKYYINMFNLKNLIFSNNHSNSLEASKNERDELCKTIIDSSSLKAGFYLLIVLSTFIVTIGLLKNNIILTIGGMLVAPLLSPILSISLSLTIFNLKVFFRSIRIFIVSALVSLIVSYILGLIANFSLDQISLIEIMKAVDYTAFLIPIAAGAAGSFTWVKKDLNSSLPGVAITVTLLPPLTVMGLALSVQNFIIFQEALHVYLLNVLGIVIGSWIIFMAMGFYKSTKKIVEEIKLEEKN